MVAARRGIYAKAAKTEGAMKAPQRFIYVIGPLEGAQKVGLTTDPKARLATLQTGCPQELVIHVAVRVPFGEAHAVERRAHRLLEQSKVKNEWFDITPEGGIAAVLAARNFPRNNLFSHPDLQSLVCTQPRACHCSRLNASASAAWLRSSESGEISGRSAEPQLGVGKVGCTHHAEPAFVLHPSRLSDSRP